MRYKLLIALSFTLALATDSRAEKAAAEASRRDADVVMRLGAEQGGALSARGRELARENAGRQAQVASLGDLLLMLTPDMRPLNQTECTLPYPGRGNPAVATGDNPTEAAARASSSCMAIIKSQTSCNPCNAVCKYKATGNYAKVDGCR